MCVTAQGLGLGNLSIATIGVESEQESTTRLVLLSLVSSLARPPPSMSLNAFFHGYRTDKRTPLASSTPLFFSPVAGRKKGEAPCGRVCVCVAGPPE